MALDTESSYQCSKRKPGSTDVRTGCDKCSSANVENDGIKNKSQNEKRRLAFRISYAPHLQNSEKCNESSCKHKTSNTKQKEAIYINKSQRYNNTGKCSDPVCNTTGYNRTQTNTQYPNKKDNVKNVKYLDADSKNIHKQMYTDNDRNKSKNTVNLKEENKSTDYDSDKRNVNYSCQDKVYNKRKCRATRESECRKNCVNKSVETSNERCKEDYKERQNCNKRSSHSNNRNLINKQTDKRPKNIENQSTCTKNNQKRLDESRLNEQECSCERIQVEVEADESFVLNCDVNKDNHGDTCSCSDDDDDEDSYYTSLACSSSMRRHGRLPLNSKPLHEKSSKTPAESNNPPTPSDTQCTKPGCNKADKCQPGIRGLCSYIFSPFVGSAQLEDVEEKTVKPGGKSTGEKEMWCRIFEEINCLKHEIESMKQCPVEVKSLINESSSLKKEFEKLRKCYEKDRGKLKLLLEEKCAQPNNKRKSEASGGDMCELSESCKEVMDAMSQKLSSVMKRFQLQESLVCERSSSFTKFTENYRHIIEEYCKNLSTRVNDWFESKRKRIEHREEMLKREYQMCCHFIETEQRNIGDRISRINKKCEEYEKHIQQQMMNTSSKYLPDSHNVNIDTNFKTAYKPNWSRILKPRCDNFKDKISEKCDYTLTKDKTDGNYASRKAPKNQSVCHEVEKKNSYSNRLGHYDISRKFSSACERKNYQKSKSVNSGCNGMKNDYSGRNHFVSRDIQIYEMPQEIVYSKQIDQTSLRRSYSADPSVSEAVLIPRHSLQDKAPDDQDILGKYSVFDRIEDYFERANKKSISFSEGIPSSIALTL